MLLGAAVALGALGALHWRIRTLVRPGRPCSRAEMFVAGAVVFTLGCGTTMIFLASRAWVYHEAILWGVAWSLASYERIIAFIRAPRTGRLVAASAFATLAFLSRPSVGLGPVIALGLVFAGLLLRELRRRLARRGADPTSAPRRILDRLDWLGPNDESNRSRWILATFLAVLVPMVVYAYVNYSRFGTFFSVPWTKQFLVGVDLQHRRLLDSNGGTYFGFKFGPTTLLQYLRPDALAPNSLFPFVTFPRFRTVIIGDLSFDTLDWSTSVTASMPALALLGAFGLWATVVCSYARTRALAALRVPMLGAGAGVILVLAIAFVANRYLGDWLPLLALGGAGRAPGAPAPPRGSAAPARRDRRVGGGRGPGRLRAVGEHLARAHVPAALQPAGVPGVGAGRDAPLPVRHRLLAGRPAPCGALRGLASGPPGPGGNDRGGG